MQAIKQGCFPRKVLRLIITDDLNGLLYKFKKMKPPVFQGTELEDALSS